MKCRIMRHDVDMRDYMTQRGPGGETFIYCTAHEPLTDAQRARVERWAASWKDAPAPELRV